MKSIGLWSLARLACRDRAWRAELARASWGAMGAKVAAFKATLAQGAHYALAVLAVAAFFFVVAVAGQALNALGHLATGKFSGHPMRLTALRIESGHQKAWAKLTERGEHQRVHPYPAVAAALKRMENEDLGQDVVLGPSEKEHVEAALKRLRAHAKGQALADEQEAAVKWARLARSGASVEEAARALRQDARETSRQKEFEAIQAALVVASSSPVGWWEMFISLWPGERGLRDQALAEESSGTVWMGGFAVVGLLLFGLLGWAWAQELRQRVKTLVESHQDRLQSEAQAQELARASKALQGGAKKSPPRL